MSDVAISLQRSLGVIPAQPGSALYHRLEKLGQELQQKPGDLAPVWSFVRENYNAKLPVSGGTRYVRFCDLSGTIYMGHTYMLQSWEELYLPKPTKMAVLGTLESSRGMLPVPQWIVLLGEDGRVYVYEDEKIHLIAESLRDLLQRGIQYTATTYLYPDVPPEDEEILQQDPEIQEIRQRTKDLLIKNDTDFDDW